VEFYLDMNHDRGRSMLPDDLHFIISYFDLIVVSKGSTNVTDQWTPLDYGFADTPEGYAFELALPWVKLGVALAPESVMGMLLAQNDCDAFDTRAAQYAFLPDAVWSRPDDWGRSVLKE
jgi:hypothetical protein